MPKGGFGNLIALPLQKEPRENGCSVFVDADFRPHPDQWAYLASVQAMAPQDIEPTILRATGGMHPLDVTFIDDEDLATPWKRSTASLTNKLSGPMPKSITLTLANLVYFEKAQLPQPLANRLIRLAAFQNPKFYRAQALLKDNGIDCGVMDERFHGVLLATSFASTLRSDQETAVAAMLRHDAGVLCAATAFGKTVAAAAMIAQRGVNTLILVHRTELLKQWEVRLQTFLAAGKGLIGTIGGGKAKPTGKIDIAVMHWLEMCLHFSYYMAACQRSSALS